ncbi:hypothetical protein BDN72DRAFT_904617 [Pluteus cervinus]|uniref:Uncharacterized protein n=1 Tax=Pluteus cervinus TaxID=181527 RepID=A0ACD3A572_9AGAR|nr:hypothetical protein BDN72DRAFT_904617 [Pluteus cervinus]
MQRSGYGYLLSVNPSRYIYPRSSSAPRAPIILPEDILRSVVHQLSPWDDSNHTTLRNLAGLSQVLNHVSTPLLYCSPYSSLDTLAKLRRFLRTLKFSPHLALLVREYKVPREGDLRKIPTKEVKPFWETLARALPRTRNLVILRFCAYPSCPYTTLRLEDCTFPHLRVLNWLALNNSELWGFLERHPNLTSIDLTWPWLDPQNYDRLQQECSRPQILPALKYLCSDLRRLEMFLPNRDVRRIRWRPPLDWEPQITPALMRTLSNIHWMWLDLDVDEQFKDLMPLIGGCLDNLQVLRLGVLWENDDLEGLIQHLPELRRLIFFDEDMSFEDAQEKAHSLFQVGHTNLNHVDIAIEEVFLFHQFCRTIPAVRAHRRIPNGQVNVRYEGTIVLEDDWMELVE